MSRTGHSFDTFYVFVCATLVSEIHKVGPGGEREGGRGEGEGKGRRERERGGGEGEGNR